MDNSNPETPQEPIDNLPQQLPSPAVEPQQTIVSSTPPKTKSKKGPTIVIVVVLLLVAISTVAWFVFGKNDSQNPASQQTENSSQASKVTKNSSKCAYIPKQNYKENEGLYSIWRENAKNVNFEVYLPCSIIKDFTIAELGISDENGGKVFLRFNRPEPASGEDNLQDDTWFYVQAKTPNNGCTSGCTKAGDSKFGPVYKNSQGDLYVTINNAIVVWSFPPYDDSGDVKPMIDIIDTLQKVNPAKLEFFNG